MANTRSYKNNWKKLRLRISIFWFLFIFHSVQTEINKMIKFFCIKKLVNDDIFVLQEAIMARKYF